MITLTVLLFEAHQGAIGERSDSIDVYDTPLVSTYPSIRVKKPTFCRKKDWWNQSQEDLNTMVLIHQCCNTTFQKVCQVSLSVAECRTFISNSRQSHRDRIGLQDGVHQ